MMPLSMPVNAADLAAAACGRRKARWPVIPETAGLARSECPAAEALVRQQVTGRRAGLQQVRADLALVYCRGHDAPGPHDAAAPGRS